MRNRVKRQLRAIVKDLHPDLEQGYDVVIVAKRSAGKKPTEAFLRIVRELTQQAGLAQPDGQKQ